MAVITTDLICNLAQPVSVTYLHGNLFSLDNDGNTINVTVMDNGEPATIGGSVSANVIRSDGGTVAVSGTISGNKCSITLPQACYAIPGVIHIIIKLTESSTVTTIAAVVANVYMSSTDTVVDPGTVITSIQDLIDQIEDAVDSIPVDYSGLLATIASDYSTSKTYSVGEYAWYSGVLKRCIVPITAAESYTAAHWTNAIIGDDISDVKSAFNAVTGKPNLLDGVTWTTGQYIKDDGTIASSANSRYSSLISIPNGTYTLVYDEKVSTVTTRVHQYDANGDWVKIIISSSPTTTGIRTDTLIIEADTKIRISTGIPTRAGLIALTIGEEIENTLNDLYADIEKVNNGIGVLKEYETGLTLTSSKYIGTDGVISNVSNSGYKVSQYIDVEGFDKVHFNASAHKSALMIAFYDENQAFLSGLHGTDSYSTNQVTDIPYNAKYVVLAQNGYGAANCVLGKWYYSASEIISNDFAEKTEILTGTTSVAYINSSGVITAHTGAYRVLQVPVSEGDVLKVNGYADTYSHYFAFYDTNGDYISGKKRASGDSSTISNFETVVPANAVKIAIAGNTSYSPTPSGIKVIGQYPTGVLKWKGKKWVCFGDSLTAVNSRTDVHYFDYVAESTGITVVNKGVSGSGYRNQAGVSSAFYQKVSECPTDADVVTIFGSFNDGITDLGTATDTGTTTVGGCINTTIDNLYAVYPTVQLGIVSPTPWVGANPYNHAEYNVYVDLLEEICKRRSIPFLNLYYESNLRPWDATFRSLAYTKDDGNGVHPDETGHKIIAPRFLAFLDSLIE